MGPLSESTPIAVIGHPGNKGSLSGCVPSPSRSLNLQTLTYATFGLDTLKLSVLLSLSQNPNRMLLFDLEQLFKLPTGVSQALYSPPGLGVVSHQLLASKFGPP